MMAGVSVFWPPLTPVAAHPRSHIPPITTSCYNPPPPPNHLKAKAPTHWICHHPSLPNDWPQLLQTSITSRRLSLGLAIHAFLIKLGLSPSNDPFLGNNLINLYVKFHKLAQAQRVFDEMPVTNTISWTSLMNGYSQLEDVVSVTRIAGDMGESTHLFTHHTCTVLLQACGGATRQGLILGQQVHALAIKMEFDKKLFVATSLISMYSKSGSLEDAERVFKGLAHFDIRCFNSMILGYGEHDHGTRAINTFHDLMTSGLEPNDYTFTNLITASTAHALFHTGRQLHGLATKFGYVTHVSVANALITMYGRYGLIKQAETMFHSMGGQRNLVSWTALLSGYVNHAEGEAAATTFIRILLLHLPFDSRCLATVIHACSDYKGGLRFGLQLHGLATKLSHLSDALVATALIHTYVNLGCLRSAALVYHTLSNPTFISFNAIISGYSGDEKQDILDLFNDLRSSGMEPDLVTFARLLSLYATQPSLAKGRMLHAYIVKVGLDSELIVSNSIITMYSKCGSIQEASQVFYSSIKCDLVTWNAMISGYALHGQGEEAFILFENMEQQGFKPDGITILALLQACTYSGLFQHGFHIFKVMESRYLIKPLIQHYSCMVDLLGRSGYLAKAMDFIKGSPFPGSPMLWRTLVNACKLHGDLEFGILASKHLLQLVPQDAASYILVSNMYNEAKMLGDAAKVRTMMNDKKLRKETGCSWIEIENQVHQFIANDKDHPCSGEIYTGLGELTAVMKEKYDTTVH